MALARSSASPPTAFLRRSGHSIRVTAVFQPDPCCKPATASFTAPPPWVAAITWEPYLSVSTNGEFTSLASFDYARGAFPSNGLIQAVDGSLYGTASAGGTNGGWGTVFRLTTDGTLTALHSFNYQDGAVAGGGLVQGADGNLYGATSQGGTAGLGTVFQITTNGQLTTLVRFNGTNGANPQSRLDPGA